jgi:hypothetical protein
MTWIFNDLRKDSLWLYLPGLIALALSWSLPSTDSSVAFLIYAFLAKEFFDSGHVYTTLWRTYLNPVERARTRIYLYAPIVLFLFFFSWGFLQLPYLGALVVYATIYHNVRQFFGISKWYQRLNGKFRRYSDYFLYFNCWMPFLIAHFRMDFVWNSYYSPQDIFRWPNEQIFQVLMVIYFAGILAWLGYEISIARKHPEWNRILAIAFPSLLYGIAFIRGRTAMEMIFPLVVAHGVGYFALMSFALNKTQERFFNFRKAVVLILVTALFFGVLEAYYEDLLDLSTPAVSGTMAFLIAIYLTPLFCHYYFDSFLWKAQHPDAKSIYSDYTKYKNIS